MKLMPLRTAIRDELADSPEAILTTRIIDRALANAVGDLSRYFPQYLIYDSTIIFTITGEAFTSAAAHGTYASLANVRIKYDTETVTNAAGTTTYTRDTDYTMDYANGRITTIDGGDMAVATAYLVSYTILKIGISISDIMTGLVRIDKVEYPAGLTPQKFISFEKYGSWLTFLGAVSGQESIAEEKHAWVYYRAVHTIPTELADGTYPSFLDEAVLKGTIAYCYGTLYHYWLLQAKTHLAAAVTAVAATEEYATGTTDSAKETLATVETETDLANAALDKVAALVTAADAYLDTGDDLINTVNTGTGVGELYRDYALTELKQAETHIAEAQARIAHGNVLVSKASQMNTVSYNLDTSAKNYLGVVAQDLELAKQYRERANDKLGEFYATLKNRTEWLQNSSSVPALQSKG